MEIQEYLNSKDIHLFTIGIELLRQNPKSHEEKRRMLKAAASEQNFVLHLSADKEYPRGYYIWNGTGWEHFLKT